MAETGFDQSAEQRSEAIVQELTGWKEGKGLSYLADIIEYYPGFPRDAKFGVIGDPQHPTVNGYDQKQLAGVLRRWESELQLAEGKPGSARLTDKDHWELATLEAVKKVGGRSWEPFSGTTNRRIEELREKVVARSVGFRPIPSGVKVSETSFPIKTAHVENLVRMSRFTAFLDEASSVVRAVARRPALLLPLAAVACGVAFGGNKTSPPEQPSPTPGETVPGQKEVSASFFSTMELWNKVQFHDVNGKEFTTNGEIRIPQKADGSLVYLEQKSITGAEQQMPHVIIGRAGVGSSDGTVEDLLFMFELNDKDEATGAYYLRFDQDASTADQNSYAQIAVGQDGSLNKVGALSIPVAIPDQSKPFGTLTTGKGEFNLVMPTGSTQEIQSDLDAMIAFMSNASPALAKGLEPTATPPVSSPTPEPTKDPNMPPDATGKDKEGRYIKGDYTLLTIQYGDTADASVTGWFRNGNKYNRPIDIYDKDESGGPTSFGPMTTYFSEANDLQNSRIIYIVHPVPTVNTTRDKLPTFSTVWWSILMLQREKIPLGQGYPYYQKLLDGGFIHFVSPTGEVDDWAPVKGYDFYQIPWEDADPATHPGFHESHFPGESKNIAYRWFVTTDKVTHKLIGFGAFPPGTPPTDEQTIRLTLTPLAEVTAHQNIPPADTSNYYFDSDVVSIFHAALDTRYGPPHFEVSVK